MLLQVTQDPRAVLPLQWEELGGLEGVELQVLFGSMARQIQGLLAQRDTHLEVHRQILTNRSRTTEEKLNDETRPFSLYRRVSSQRKHHCVKPDLKSSKGFFLSQIHTEPGANFITFLSSLSVSLFPSVSPSSLSLRG